MTNDQAVTIDPHVLALLMMERGRQDRKWGLQDHDDLVWLAVLTEEFGEIGRALCENDEHGLEDEIIQTAAVCIAWLESRDRRRD